jgi:H+-transporting ATPase
MAEKAHLSGKEHDEAEVDASMSSSANQKIATLSLADLQTRLNWSADGLSHEEAQRRLARYGPNELPEEKINPLLKFLSYFWGPIPWMIEAAAILSAFVRHWADFVIIMILLVVNAIVGFWEEYQAGSAVAALKETLALQARARRAGVWTTVPARELVPGDTIRLRIGDIVPADAKLLEGDPVRVDQSTLTGESLPVVREMGDAVYSGSIMKQGEIDALVYATGRETYFGRAASLVETAQTVGHFRRAVLKIGDYLIVLAIGLVVLILAVALFRGDNMLTAMQFALVLTVAAIPVAMPTVLSITMALGARILVQRQAIVTRLSSIEELAGVDLLCVDKTGTLTQNSLTLGDPFTLDGVPSEQLVLCAALASRREDQDPIDLAVLSALDDGRQQDSYQVLHFKPFDPVHKRTEAEVQGPDGTVFSVAKGAPQVILQLAADAPRIQSQVESAVDEFAARGFRSLGVARTDAEGQWQFLGVLPLYDPPRADSRETIETARHMGVRVKMVTGDQIAIAREIARQLGLGTNILEASAFQEAAYHEEAQLADTIEKADGFAEVFPEHKYHIVDVLQQRGHIVGMTGDGVNDAPALKKADAGVAVSGATDAARSAADVVLLAPGLCVITDAIGESRRIFERMTSYAIYRIAETIRVLLFMTFSILAFNFYPVTAVMIVLLALLNDGAILSIAYDRVRASNEPRAWNMQEVLGIATALGVAGVVASFGLFYAGESVFHLSQEAIQSLMYLKLSVAGHLTIFLTRTRGPFWSSRPATVLIGAVVATQALATLIAVYGIFMAPIGWPWALLVWAYALLWFLINDRVKLAAYRIFGSQEESLLAKWCKK